MAPDPAKSMGRTNESKVEEEVEIMDDKFIDPISSEAESSSKTHDHCLVT